MTKKSIFFRFTAIYALAVIVAGYTVNFLEIEIPINLNTPILIAISYWCLISYSKNNNRVIDRNEKWKIIWLLVLGATLVSALLVLPFFITEEIPLQFFAIGLALSIPVHLIIFLGVDHFVRKRLIKQNAFTS